jgi:regulator of protease activity HflC (stomatin/prohibitin superfamily)
MELFTIIGFIVAMVALSSIRFVNEYDRLVIFRMGRAIGVRGPGLCFVMPVLEMAKKVDLRIITMSIPMQEIITKDNVSAKTAAVCFFQVIDPFKVVTKIEDPYTATNQIAQTTLRSVLGQHDLDHLLADRDTINAKLQAMIDRQTEGWGIKVNTVEVKDVEIPDNMQRAMARQAEAERERRAKVVAAEGELQAAEKLSQAAALITSQPGAMQLRQLQSMVEVSAEKNTTLIFPIPIELMDFARSAAAKINQSLGAQAPKPEAEDKSTTISVKQVEKEKA